VYHCNAQDLRPRARRTAQAGIGRTSARPHPTVAAGSDRRIKAGGDNGCYRWQCLRRCTGGRVGGRGVEVRRSAQQCHPACSNRHPPHLCHVTLLRTAR